MKKSFSVLSRPLAAAVCILSLAACSTMNSKTAENTLVGGGVGLGVGALVSVVSAGCIPCGAAVGTAVGAGAGLAYDQTHNH